MIYLSLFYEQSTDELEMIFHIYPLNSLNLPFSAPLTEKYWHVKAYLSAYDFGISRQEYKFNAEGLLYNLK